MNIVSLVGRWSRDPELKALGDGKSVVNCNIAVTNTFKKNDDGSYGADFINVTVWNKQAENVAKYTKKGSQVAITGRIETGSYDKDGTTIYTTSVTATQVQFLDSKGSSDNRFPSEPPSNDEIPIDDGDIPF
jgi:single-strand DNA-binding protein